jgi:GTPase SAR1 family protein
LEGHTDLVRFVAPTGSKRLLVSESRDGTFRIWRLKDGAAVAVLKHECSDIECIGVHGTTLVYLDRPASTFHVWGVDDDALCNATVTDSVRYRNAKIVLVGDSGTGKSGLGLVLTGREWAPTESTHGRHVWTMADKEVTLPGGVQEKRETLLWDLAGQPGYRLIHQLHLADVSVALVVFDARSDVDPLAGVLYWNRALTQARRLKDRDPMPLRKFLVVARCDRGGVSVSDERLKELARELGYDGVFKTSAKEGWEIPALTEAMLQAVDWDNLPWVGSNKLFEELRAFLVDEKQKGRLLATADDLFRAFSPKHRQWGDVLDLRAVFDTCVGRLEQRGLIRWLRFGRYLLLQPELLDAYASALVNAAKDEPDGLGCLDLDDALAGRFRIPADERVPDPDMEHLLLISTVEELLGHELALKEVADDQTLLVFPSQFRRERPDAPSLPGRSVIFGIDGPTMSAYATLAVRLAHSRLFVKQAMWRNVATYRATVGGICGISLRETEDGHGELILFFDSDASEATRYQFEDYVASHLQRRTLSGTLARRRIFACGNCGAEVTEQQAVLRRERGHHSLTCPVCENTVSLLDREERLAKSAVAQARDKTAKMDRAANTARDRATAAMVLKGKEATDDFDVFLSHNSRDKDAVRAIADALRERGILPWLDERELRPGMVWQDEIERVIGLVKAAAVIVGPHGFSDWLGEERRAFEREAKKRQIPIIPVILPEVIGQPKLPLHLEGKTWVDFRRLETKPLERLVWGITGKKEPFGEAEQESFSEAEPELQPHPPSARPTGRSGWVEWLKGLVR